MQTFLQIKFENNIKICRPIMLYNNNGQESKYKMQDPLKYTNTKYILRNQINKVQTKL